MEQKIEKSFSNKNQESAESSWDMSEDENVKKIKNSWDSNSSKNENLNEKPYNSDWDIDSDCKETLVMPFNKEHFSDSPWDSESKEFNEKKFKIVKANEKPVEETSSLESLNIKSEKNNLVVEDIEEIILDGDASQDNTVWKIPTSARTDTDELDSIDEIVFNVAKSNSCPKIGSPKKILRNVAHSKSEGQFCESNIILDTLHPYEGKILEEKKEILKKDEKSLLDDLTSPQGNYYREYETMPVIPLSDEDITKACVTTYERPDEEIEIKAENVESDALPYLTDEPSTSYDSNPPSSNVSVDSSKFKSYSLPIRKSEKFGKKKFIRKAVNCKYQEKAGNKNEKKANLNAGKSKGAIPKVKRDCRFKERPVTESWIFLDESGFSQQVTKQEVNILLNGRSADAVLQEQKTLLVPEKSVRNASSELISNDWTPAVHKNLHSLICQEDVAEEASGKSIGLERKLGNMLLYIRSKVDLEASVRFITVDTNMVNLWRQSRDFTESTPEPNTVNSTNELQSIILQNSKTIEALAEDLKRMQNKLENEMHRNGELEKEIENLRKANVKISEIEVEDDSTGRLSEQVIECETFEYSSSPRPVSTPKTKIDGGMPKFIGITRSQDEKPCTATKSTATVNLYSVNNEESESVTSNDELPSYTDGKLNKTGGFYGDGFDPGKNSENRPATKLKTRSTSCYEEDSETESLQSNSEHKSKSEWLDLVKNLLEEVEESKKKLREHGHQFDYDEVEDEASHNLSAVRSYLKAFTEHIIKRKNLASPEINPDDYYRMISEKAALIHENKTLKAENNLLLESQIEQYEKLKRIEKSSNELKSQNLELENDKKILEAEKAELMSKIKKYEDEKKDFEDKMNEKEDLLNKEMKKGKMLEDVIAKKEAEMRKANEKLGILCGKFENFEEAQKSKDETINRLKSDNKELVSKDSLNICAIEFLTEKVKSIETEKLNLESELASLKTLSEESDKEARNYITNLEKILHDAQENYQKAKQKLLDSNKSLSSLKKDFEILNDKYNAELGRCKKLKEKAEEYKEKILAIMEENQEMKREREKSLNDLKNESESLKMVIKGYKSEILALKRKIENSATMKDKLIKEQKDLLNEISIAKRDFSKLEVKYKKVKVECNERTTLITHLETLLRKSVSEYNEKIVNLEKSMSVIIEKVSEYKESVKEKNLGNETKVMSLESKLQASDQEKWSLEREVANYYNLVKKLQMELEEKKKSSNELSGKLMIDRERLKEKVVKSFGMQTEEESEKGNFGEVLDDDKEKKKMKALIAELQLENERYQAKIEVMMKNLSNCGRNLSDLSSKQKDFEEKEKKIADLESNVRNLTNKLNEKSKELKNAVKKIEELKENQTKLKELETSLAREKKNAEFCRKERNEMADKLLQSVRLVMEERAAKQGFQMLVSEKEKRFTEEVNAFKQELEEKKLAISNLHEDITKYKQEITQLKSENADITSKKPFVSPRDQNQKIKDFMLQLKSVRNSNLQLRKKEGELQAKIVLLEEEIRNARISIKQLQGELKTEKKSKKAFKSTIMAAEEEIRKLQIGDLICPSSAEKIKRHFNLLDLSS